MNRTESSGDDVQVDVGEALRQSEERFRILVESVQDDAIFMLDSGGHVISWNLGAKRLKGYEASEIVGRHFSTFYRIEDIAEGRPTRLLNEALTRGSTSDEGWRVRQDGSMGAEARSAYDGPSALELVRSWGPTIVLLDLGMPGMDGYVVAYRIRQDPAISAVRLIALTGWGSADDRRHTAAAGFDDHWVKPVDPVQLQEMFTSAGPSQPS